MDHLLFASQAACGSCRFFVPPDEGQGDIGHCRFNPPTLIMIPTMNPLTHQQGMSHASFFPPVNAAYWCGQWKDGAPNVKS